MVAEVRRQRKVLEHFLGRFINRYAQLAHISVPWMGSRPELVVKAVPMLASSFGFVSPPCLQPLTDTLSRPTLKHTSGML